MNNLKVINIGLLIKQRVQELQMDTNRICNVLNCNDADLVKIYQSESTDTNNLLKLSKLLDYDFFRLYTQHLIFYTAGNRTTTTEKLGAVSQLPQFKKNIYTQEIINFVIELIEKKEKTILEIMTEYNIPKTTLYRWLQKHKA